MSKPTTRRRFGKELKVNAVHRVLNGEKTSDVARDIGVRYTMIDKWRRAYVDEQKEVASKEQSKEELDRLRRLEVEYKILEDENSALRLELGLANRRLLFIIDTFQGDEKWNNPPLWEKS